jgi:hypothetical protein
MNKAVYAAGLAVLGLLVWLLVSALGGSDAAAEAGPHTVYLCRETQDLVSGPPQPTPAVNPQTGRRTLYRALYCARCEQWRAIPPSENSGGNPLSNLCPRHRQPMSPTGPLPGNPQTP